MSPERLQLILSVELGHIRRPGWLRQGCSQFELLFFPKDCGTFCRARVGRLVKNGAVSWWWTLTGDGQHHDATSLLDALEQAEAACGATEPPHDKRDGNEHLLEEERARFGLDHTSEYGSDVYEPCSACGGVGWLVGSGCLECGSYAVRACDKCGVFATDEEAAVAVRAVKTNSIR